MVDKSLPQYRCPCGHISYGRAAATRHYIAKHEKTR